MDSILDFFWGVLRLRLGSCSSGLCDCWFFFIQQVAGRVEGEGEGEGFYTQAADRLPLLGLQQAAA